MSLFREERATTPDRRLLIIVLFLSVPIALIFFVLIQVIPPFTGRVVDAVSGKSIQDVRLALETSRYEGESVQTELRDSTTSGTSGWFFLNGVLRSRGLPLSTLRSHWFTVNEGEQISGQDESSAASQTMYNPMFNRMSAAVGDTRYFPMTVTFQRNGCDRVWQAACIFKHYWWGISLPLIPVLENIDDCKKIGDLSLQERCRQLNTYRAAFVHVDTYDEVQHGKALCTEVDHGSVSSTCLQQLGIYIANPRPFQRSFNQPVNEPIPDGMFPESIAGLPVMSNKHCGPRILFDGLLRCAASYRHTLSDGATVYVQLWQKAEAKPPLISPWNEKSGSEELHSGGKVMRFPGHTYTGIQRADGTPVTIEHKSVAFAWYSGNVLVEVSFFDPKPEQEQFISYYLGRFPSTL